MTSQDDVTITFENVKTKWVAKKAEIIKAIDIDKFLATPELSSLGLSKEEKRFILKNCWCPQPIDFNGNVYPYVKVDGYVRLTSYPTGDVVRCLKQKIEGCYVLQYI